LGQLEVFPPGSEVTPELLLERGLVRRKDEPIKILAAGSFSKSLTIKAHGFSSKAKERIESLGGKAELLQGGYRQEATSSGK
jgi:large subunit ribosomal protein L15